MTTETFSGDIYCLKCKTKRDIKNAAIVLSVSEKGRETRIAKSECPVCGSKLTRLLGKATTTA